MMAHRGGLNKYSWGYICRWIVCKYIRIYIILVYIVNLPQGIDAMHNRPSYVYWLDLRQYEDIPNRYDKDILSYAIEKYLIKSYGFDVRSSYNHRSIKDSHVADKLTRAFMHNSPFTGNSINSLTAAFNSNTASITFNVMVGPCIIVNQ